MNLYVKLNCEVNFFSIESRNSVNSALVVARYRMMCLVLRMSTEGDVQAVLRIELIHP